MYCPERSARGFPSRGRSFPRPVRLGESFLPVTLIWIGPMKLARLLVALLTLSFAAAACSSNPVAPDGDNPETVTDAGLGSTDI